MGDITDTTGSTAEGLRFHRPTHQEWGRPRHEVPYRFLGVAISPAL
jgi:hypothetical protein